MKKKNHQNSIKFEFNLKYYDVVHQSDKKFLFSCCHKKKKNKRIALEHQELTQLQLDDNRITTIASRAFMNLNKLKYLTIRGNKLDTVSDEAFQVFLLHFHLNSI